MHVRIWPRAFLQVLRVLGARTGLCFALGRGGGGWGVGGGGGDDDSVTQTPRTISAREPLYSAFTVPS